MADGKSTPISAKPRFDMPGGSVLAASGTLRVALALALSAVLWLAVFWAIAP